MDHLAAESGIAVSGLSTDPGGREWHRLHWLADAAEHQISANIVPFWLALRDDERGGFFGKALDRSRIDRNAPKGTVLSARILWTFASLHDAMPGLAVADTARHARDHMLERHVDPEHGGVFWSVSADGAPLDTRKHLYGQAFAVYGLATAARVMRDDPALAAAQRLWASINAKSDGLRFPWRCESFSRDWLPLPNDLMGKAEAQASMNVLLHLIEAAHALWLASGEAGVKADLLRLLETVLALDNNCQSGFASFYGPGPPDYTLSLGHDIEAYWLTVTIAAGVDAELGQRAATRLAAIPETVAGYGITRDGALIAGRDLRGKLDRNKLWWVQAEALVGYLVAFEQTGDLRHLDRVERLWRFVETRLADRAGEDWRQLPVGILGRNRNLPRADAWKCPYHSTRACLELMTRARRLAMLAGPDVQYPDHPTGSAD